MRREEGKETGEERRNINKRKPVEITNKKEHTSKKHAGVQVNPDHTIMVEPTSDAQLRREI